MLRMDGWIYNPSEGKNGKDQPKLTEMEGRILIAEHLNNQRAILRFTSKIVHCISTVYISKMFCIQELAIIIDTITA